MVKLLESLNNLYRALLLVCVTLIFLVSNRHQEPSRYANYFGALENIYTGLLGMGSLAGSTTGEKYRRELLDAAKSMPANSFTSNLTERLAGARIQPATLILTTGDAAEPLLLKLRPSDITTGYLEWLASLNADASGVSVGKWNPQSCTLDQYHFTNATVEQVVFKPEIALKALDALFVGHPIKADQKEIIYLEYNRVVGKKCNISTEPTDQSTSDGVGMIFPCELGKSPLPPPSNWQSLFGGSRWTIAPVLPRGFGGDVYAVERVPLKEAVNKMLRDDPVEKDMFGASIPKDTLADLGPYIILGVLIMMLAASLAIVHLDKPIGDDGLFWTAQFHGLAAVIMFVTIILVPAAVVGWANWTENAPLWDSGPDVPFWQTGRFWIDGFMYGAVAGGLGFWVFCLNRQLAGQAQNGRSSLEDALVYIVTAVAFAAAVYALRAAWLSAACGYAALLVLAGLIVGLSPLRQKLKASAPLDFQIPLLFFGISALAFPLAAMGCLPLQPWSLALAPLMLIVALSSFWRKLRPKGEPVQGGAVIPPA